MKAKTIIIIGGGISGLSAGIYARKSGFRTIVIEAQNNPGGNCTGWSRKGYFFEGSMHWLNGSSMASPMHRLWLETKALNEESLITNKDPFLSCDYEDKRINAFRNVDLFEAHLLEQSPQDKQHINELCDLIRHFKKLHPPIPDVFGVKMRNRGPSLIKQVPSLMPFLLRMPFLNRITVKEYAKRFKDPAIRLLLCHVVRSDYDMFSFFYIISCFMSNDGGYVEGGSIRMIKNMAQYYSELGGELKCGLKVEKISSDGGTGGKVRGVIANGELIPGEAVILAFDLQNAADDFFDFPLRESWMDRLWKKTGLIINTFIGLGIRTDLSSIPEAMVFPVAPFEYGGARIENLLMYNYAGVAGYAPPGCSAVTIRIQSDSYDYWKEMKDKGLYNLRKEELFMTILGRLEEKYPSIRGKTEVWDIATPLTYERYCGSWRGCWMTVPLPGRKTYNLKSRNLRGLYFAGHRMMPPGGMPPALMTGRRAVQYLCRDFHVPFG